MYISNANPHIFIRDLIAAIEDGWRILPTNEGSISQAFILELKLFKDVDVTSTELQDYKVTLAEHDAQKFIVALQNALLNGYTVNESSLVWDSMGIKQINVENKNHPKAKIYTREELDALPWDDLRSLFQSYGIRGRQREVVTVALMKAQQEENK